MTRFLSRAGNARGRATRIGSGFAVPVLAVLLVGCGAQELYKPPDAPLGIARILAAPRGKALKRGVSLHEAIKDRVDGPLPIAVLDIEHSVTAEDFSRVDGKLL